MGTASGINFSSLRDHARKELVDVLDSLRGRKALVLDPHLSGPLTLIAQTALLKEHGVEQLFRLDSQLRPDSLPGNVMYLVQPTVAHMKAVATQVRELVVKDARDAKSRGGPGGEPARLLSVVCVPRRSMVCDKVLNDEGVMGDVSVREYNLELIPLEDDLVSMELGAMLRGCAVDGDRSPLFYTARALLQLQKCFGRFPRILGKGHAAYAVADMMARLEQEGPPSQGAEQPSGFSCAIFLDRAVDLVTPLCTQMTYEGLIDEVIGVHNSTVEVEAPAPPSLAPGTAGYTSSGPSASAAPPKKVKILLSSADALFNELRDMSFGAVGDVLRERAVAMQNEYKGLSAPSGGGGGGGGSVSELHRFVRKLNTLPEIQRHTQLAETLARAARSPGFGERLATEQSLLDSHDFDAACATVEDWVARQEPLPAVLRLLCLASLTNGGLPRRFFDSIRRELLQAYGYEHLTALTNLERAGLLVKQESRAAFHLVRRALNLLVENVDSVHPDDFAFTHAGYAPLSIRLVQQVVDVHGSWQPMEEYLRLLPGPHFDLDIDRQAQQGYQGAQAINALPVPGVAGAAPRGIILVVFIGGVTFSEIASLRFLNAKSSRFHFAIATTKVVNGNTLLQTLME